VKVLKACVPASVPGIAFLSGGQSDEEATAHLDAINRIGDLPWSVTFSYGRALQAAPQKTWSGKPDNVAAAQRAFAHRARMNGLAARGEWKAELEKKRRRRSVASRHTRGAVGEDRRRTANIPVLASFVRTLRPPPLTSCSRIRSQGR
jgi:hypothetical protein